MIDGECDVCSINCEQCFAANICKRCKDGFMLSNYDQNSSVCIACDSKCLTCIESTTNCESCVEGFKIIGSKCISEKMVSFTLKVNLDINKFSNNLYNQVIQEIAAISVKPITSVRIVSLNSGSVVILGFVNVNNTED